MWLTSPSPRCSSSSVPSKNLLKSISWYLTANFSRSASSIKQAYHTPSCIGKAMLWLTSSITMLIVQQQSYRHQAVCLWCISQSDTLMWHDLPSSTAALLASAVASSCTGTAAAKSKSGQVGEVCSHHHRSHMHMHALTSSQTAQTAHCPSAHLLLPPRQPVHLPPLQAQSAACAHHVSVHPHPPSCIMWLWTAVLITSSPWSHPPAAPPPGCRGERPAGAWGGTVAVSMQEASTQICA